ncbi:MAG: nucleotidyltransferase family protein [Acidimicrobiia bacterium]|nr:nucleotidyltransferase family protein [Acidimicrobiia bacterium]
MTRAVLMLAGGSGSRFEGLRHKLDVDFRGRPLAAHALGVVRSLLDGSVDQVYVVTGAATLDPALDWLATAESVTVDDLGFTIVHNERWFDGQAASLAVGIDRADADGHDAVIVGLADQPLIGADAWRTVADADGVIVIADFDGRRRPPVKLDRSVWPLLPRTGDDGARSLIRLRPDLVSEVACMGNPIDIDTMEDLRRWS